MRSAETAPPLEEPRKQKLATTIKKSKLLNAQFSGCLLFCGGANE
jgi:hypothetical protein